MLNKGVGEQHRWFYPISSFVISGGFMIIMLWSLFFPHIRDFFGLNTVAPIAVASSLVGLGAMIIGPPLAGAIFDKQGPKIPLLIAGGVFLAGFLILAAMFNYDWATGRYFWYTGSFIAGLGMGFYSGTFPAVIARWFPDQLGTPMGIAVSGAAAGVVVMSPVIGALIAGLGFSGKVFVITGIIGFALVVLIGVLLWKVPSPAWKPKVKKPPAAGEEAAVEERHYTLQEASKDKRFWLLMVGFVTSAFAFMGFAQNASMIVEEGLLSGGYHQEYVVTSAVPLFLSLSGIANMLGGILWGIITDKSGGPWVTLPIIYSVSGALIAVFYLGYRFLPLVLIVGFILYFFFGGEPSVHYIVIPYVFGRKHIGKVMNVMNSFSVGLGIVLGPIVYAYLRDMTGGYIWALALAITLRFVATATVLTAARVDKKMAR